MVDNTPHLRHRAVPMGFDHDYLCELLLHSCKSFDKSVDITCVVVRGERDPNASATYTAHNIKTTKAFYNCLYAFARVSQ